MKKLRCIKLLSVVLLSSAVTAGCAGQSAKDSASKAAPEARLKEAQAAADGGDNAKAIKLADQAKFQAEAAIIQYNYEKDHPRGL